MLTLHLVHENSLQCFQLHFLLCRIVHSNYGATCAGCWRLYLATACQVLIRSEPRQRSTHCDMQPREGVGTPPGKLSIASLKTKQYSGPLAAIAKAYGHSQGPMKCQNAANGDRAADGCSAGCESARRSVEEGAPCARGLLLLPPQASTAVCNRPSVAYKGSAASESHHFQQLTGLLPAKEPCEIDSRLTSCEQGTLKHTVPVSETN